MGNLAKTYGWDGSAWRKFPLLWGYSDRWFDEETVAKNGDGNYTFTTTAVPAGYIYKLELAAIRNDTAIRGAQYISILSGGKEHFIAYTVTPVVSVPTVWSGAITLKEGDQLFFVHFSCVNNDAMRACAWGYKMKIAE